MLSSAAASDGSRSIGCFHKADKLCLWCVERGRRRHVLPPQHGLDEHDRPLAALFAPWLCNPAVYGCPCPNMSERVLHLFRPHLPLLRPPSSRARIEALNGTHKAIKVPSMGLPPASPCFLTTNPNIIPIWTPCQTTPRGGLRPKTLVHGDDTVPAEWLCGQAHSPTSPSLLLASRLLLTAPSESISPCRTREEPHCDHDIVSPREACPRGNPHHWPCVRNIPPKPSSRSSTKHSQLACARRIVTLVLRVISSHGAHDIGGRWRESPATSSFERCGLIP